MIDTDEYERINNTKGSYLSKHGVTKLIKEVKRLREGIKRLLNEGSPDRIWVHNTDLRELIE
tara:strand:- start:152 stop:337 length:186 start_codon:yes stop_codon:yes gene_type:complete